MEQLITPLTTLGHLAQLAPEQFAAPLKSLVANFIVKDLLMNDRVHSSDMERQGFYWFLSHILANSAALTPLSGLNVFGSVCGCTWEWRYCLCWGQMPGKKTTKLWVPDDEVSPETLAKVSTPSHMCDLRWRALFVCAVLCLYLNRILFYYPAMGILYAAAGTLHTLKKYMLEKELRK